MVDGQGQAGLFVSIEESVFETKAGSNSSKSEPTLNFAGVSSKISQLVYVRYLDHVILRNVREAAAEAVVREAVGWVKKENEDVLLLEHDRSVKQGYSGFNGIVVLKNCIVSMVEVPQQCISKMALNCPDSKEVLEYALQSTERKTQKVKER